MGQYMRRTGLIGLFGAGLRRRHEADLARSPERWGRPGRSRSLIFRATVPLSASSPWGPGSWRGRGGRAQGERQSRGMHREVSSPVSGQKRGQPQRTRDGCAPRRDSLFDGELEGGKTGSMDGSGGEKSQGRGARGTRRSKRGEEGKGEEKTGVWVVRISPGLPSGSERATSPSPGRLSLTPQGSATHHRNVDSLGARVGVGGVGAAVLAAVHVARLLGKERSLLPGRLRGGRGGARAEGGRGSHVKGCRGGRRNGVREGRGWGLDRMLAWKRASQCEQSIWRGLGFRSRGPCGPSPLHLGFCFLLSRFTRNYPREKRAKSQFRSLSLPIVPPAHLMQRVLPAIRRVVGFLQPPEPGMFPSFSPQPISSQSDPCFTRTAKSHCMGPRPPGEMVETAASVPPCAAWCPSVSRAVTSHRALRARKKLTAAQLRSCRRHEDGPAGRESDGERAGRKVIDGNSSEGGGK